MGASDGLVRGQEVEYLGAPISVPVGKEVLGRIFNVVGQPIDDQGPVEAKEHWPMFREPPALDEQSSSTRVSRLSSELERGRGKETTSGWR